MWEDHRYGMVRMGSVLRLISPSAVTNSGSQEELYVVESFHIRISSEFPNYLNLKGCRIFLGFQDKCHDNFQTDPTELRFSYPWHTRHCHRTSHWPSCRKRSPQGWVPYGMQVWFLGWSMVHVSTHQRSNGQKGGIFGCTKIIAHDWKFSMNIEITNLTSQFLTAQLTA